METTTESGTITAAQLNGVGVSINSAPLATAPQQAPRAFSAGNAVRAIVPSSLDEVFRLAKGIGMAGWAPKSYAIDGKPERGYDVNKIAIGIMHGMELGLTPIAALQSIAVINGMPSIWGDGALATVQASGLLEDFIEVPQADASGKVTGYTCTAKRRGIPTPFVSTFTVKDAEIAGLLSKVGPWTQYRARMLQMRARGWALRAGFADVLRGMHLAEEAQDIIDITPAPTKPGAKAKSSSAALNAFAATPTSAASADDPQPTGESDSNGNDTHPQG